MPTVNDEFNRTCLRPDRESGYSGIFTPDEVTLQFREDDLRAFSQCAERIAPGTPALDARQIAAAAWRLARAIGQDNESRFIQIRMLRAGEGEYADFCRYRAAEAQRLGFLSRRSKSIANAGRSSVAKNCAWNASFAAAPPATHVRTALRYFG